MFAPAAATGATPSPSAETTRSCSHPLLSITRDDLQRGLRLFEKTPRLGAFDAVLAAAAAQAGAVALVSADTAFSDLPDISHIVPDTAGITSLLGRTRPASGPP